MMEILVLDHDGDFRDGLVGCLEEDGHRVLAYPSPTLLPGLDILAGVEAAITEYVMDGEDGLRFAERLNQHKPEVPVIIATAYPGNHLEAAAAARNFLHLLRKPFRYEVLANLLSRLTGPPR